MIKVPEFVVGQQIAVTATFRNATTGALVDPTTVTWIVGEPDGTETSYVYGTDSEVTKSATGTYVGTIRVEQDGQHTSRWNGTGAAVASDEEWFTGQKSNLDAPI